MSVCLAASRAERRECLFWSDFNAVAGSDGPLGLRASVMLVRVGFARSCVRGKVTRP